MSESPLNFDSRTLPCGVCAIRSATTSLAATAIPERATVLTKSRRFISCPRGRLLAAVSITRLSDRCLLAAFGRIWLWPDSHCWRHRGHEEVFDANRGHERRAWTVVRFAGVNRHRLSDRRDVVVANERRHVPAEVLH